MPEWPLKRYLIATYWRNYMFFWSIIVFKDTITLIFFILTCVFLSSLSGSKPRPGSWGSARPGSETTPKSWTYARRRGPPRRNTRTRASTPWTAPWTAGTAGPTAPETITPTSIRTTSTSTQTPSTPKSAKPATTGLRLQTGRGRLHLCIWSLVFGINHWNQNILVFLVLFLLIFKKNSIKLPVAAKVIFISCCCLYVLSVSLEKWINYAPTLMNSIEVTIPPLRCHFRRQPGDRLPFMVRQPFYLQFKSVTQSWYFQ